MADNYEMFLLSSLPISNGSQQSPNATDFDNSNNNFREEFTNEVNEFMANAELEHPILMRLAYMLAGALVIILLLFCCLSLRFCCRRRRCFRNRTPKREWHHLEWTGQLTTPAPTMGKRHGMRISSHQGKRMWRKDSSGSTAATEPQLKSHYLNFSSSNDNLLPPFTQQANNGKRNNDRTKPNSISNASTTTAMNPFEGDSAESGDEEILIG